MQHQINTTLNSTFELLYLDQRFKHKDESNKKNRPKATAAQRFLIMYYSKSLDPITDNVLLSQNTKDEQVAAILDIDPDNAKKYLCELKKKSKPHLHTKTNYEFLADYFVRPGHETILMEVENILMKILNQEEF